VLFIDAGASSIPLNGLMTAGGNFCTFSDDIRQTSQHRTTTSQGKSDQRVYGVDVKKNCIARVTSSAAFSRNGSSNSIS
jgi:hypothetical protein